MSIDREWRKFEDGTPMLSFPTLKDVFLGATKHLYNWLCPLVGWLVGQSVVGDPQVREHLFFEEFGRLTLTQEVTGDNICQHNLFYCTILFTIHCLELSSKIELGYYHRLI